MYAARAFQGAAPAGGEGLLARPEEPKRRTERRLIPRRIKHTMTKPRILVTGAAGFMGSYLVDALVDEYDVYGVDDMSGGFWRNVNPKSHFTKLDLRQKQATQEYVDRVQPEMLFHLAADATEGRSQFTPVTCTARNLMAYLHTLVPAIRHGLKKVVVTSSMSVYGAQEPPFVEDMPTDPEDIYGISKAAMEQVTRVMSAVHGFAYTIVRPLYQLPVEQQELLHLRGRRATTFVHLH